MKPTLKQASIALGMHGRLSTDCATIELDALQFEEEEEGPSYLADMNKAPDFIDEPPVEVAEVSPVWRGEFILC